MRYKSFTDLNVAFDQHCQKLKRPKSTVLFRRGEKASGLFVIFKGAVELDFGVDGSVPLALMCTEGDVLGLPATLTKTPYCMTATVFEDADLGHMSTQYFFSLLQMHPELCPHLLKIVSTKLAHARDTTAHLLQSESQMTIM